MPRFSLIVVDCDDHTPRESARRGITAILAQTFADFEVVLVHDGFKRIPYEAEFDLSGLDRVTTIYSKTRFRDWGHSLRRLGMRVAEGDYFLNVNIDNLLYPDCLAKVDGCLGRDGADIVIFSIVNHKRGTDVVRTGRPAAVGSIDCLQLVASRRAWQSIGYWHRTDYQADGHLYAELTAAYPARYLDDILGENFQRGTRQATKE
ncbi:glycosyltransferase family A protein [Actinoplanes sp. NPDC049599]|uniref:glycosyltransferase family A protein n=1 Tax=Actinoplanes sp. NPDC049599 TaxID=3363903 RepID=UPI0037AD1E1A